MTLGRKKSHFLKLFFGARLRIACGLYLKHFLCLMNCPEYVQGSISVSGHSFHVHATRFTNRTHLRVSESDRSGSLVDLNETPARVLLGCRDCTWLMAFANLFQSAVRSASKSNSILLECSITSSVMMSINIEELSNTLLPFVA